MGYLDNSSITVDAILTLKGRELLSKNDGSFNITQFALGDDEIDYTLWNTDAAGGSEDYGILIENLPITEAIPDETQALRYKLLSLPAGQSYIPIVSVGSTSISLLNRQRADITPSTNLNGNTTFGYTAILADSSIAILEATSLVPGNPQPSDFSTGYGPQSISKVGFAFRVTAKELTQTKSTTITIIGNETGGSVTINLTCNAVSLATS